MIGDSDYQIWIIVLMSVVWIVTSLLSQEKQGKQRESDTHRIRKECAELYESKIKQLELERDEAIDSAGAGQICTTDLPPWDEEDEPLPEHHELLEDEELTLLVNAQIAEMESDQHGVWLAVELEKEVQYASGFVAGYHMLENDWPYRMSMSQNEIRKWLVAQEDCDADDFIQYWTENVLKKGDQEPT